MLKAGLFVELFSMIVINANIKIIKFLVSEIASMFRKTIRSLELRYGRSTLKMLFVLILGSMGVSSAQWPLPALSSGNK